MRADRPAEIGLIRFPGSQATTVHGLTDLFSYANHFAGARGGRTTPALRVRHWQADPGSDTVACTFDSHPGPDGPPAVVILPATQMAPMAPGCSPASVEWVRARHAQGAIAAAVCGGVFLLAESGLLAGRRATTHWMFAEELGRRFPGIAIEPERVVIDDGDIVTAGGVLAWADLGLSLVDRLLGPTVMLDTARFMLFDPAGREQRFYSGFAPRLQHGDRAILGVQHWLQTQATQPVAVADLAGRAGLGQRTFLRRFVKATGLRPTEYHQRLRIARARELLEFGGDTVERIAAVVGYEDAGGFRRVFKRVMGLSPADYRRRFGRPAAMPAVR
ncbi:AraC family transcriptional regulator with amidase-like domain [Stella humosa]|uniref:AraC family transcriptional regulator with amidase-like domain n=1 Tax=Stella humosa TaxID=94 RepID=A0A3N1KXD0_9PROT|nr:helix-turn-helix domain-containing protein [Stella humosa]ROP84534.1 AraC family transcriptional regulator with amidase-like domain [Stella humosa]BBK34054.1 transcriptional regulator [Stella humosa]